MNRKKKEELKRGKKFETYQMSKEEFNEYLNYFDDHTYDERLQKVLAPRLREMDERAKALKQEE